MLTAAVFLSLSAGLPFGRRQGQRQRLVDDSRSLTVALPTTRCLSMAELSTTPFLKLFKGAIGRGDVHVCPDGADARKGKRLLAAYCDDGEHEFNDFWEATDASRKHRRPATVPVPSFIDSKFTTKVEYLAWRETLGRGLTKGE